MVDTLTELDRQKNISTAKKHNGEKCIQDNAKIEEIHMCSGRIT